ncbi:serine O-acetyltransferase [Selenomonas ruminantium]|uniref:serine O-acetyltransferase n=1 Tax=Selenomonas ruminantium TaxID=971 RepID=UPI0026EF45D1|nr:serine O-acetyltransferase [Selenomonas ruminantium]
MMDVYKWYYLSRWLYLHHVPLLPFILKALIRIIWAAVIPYQADIGKGTILGYQGLGMVIHKRCIIGENCHLSQNVTLGGTSGYYEVPKLGKNVHVGAGANIIGPITVGDNCIIGAGAVVITDLPANSVAVGVPAKVIKIRNDEQQNQMEN